MTFQPIARLALLLALVFVLAACAGQPVVTQPQAAAQPSAATTSPSPTAETASADAAAGEITVAHNQGETTVSLNPAKVFT
ncbi:MAG TPA: hypothetical protein PKM78_16600, partial [Anaerolineae bacterium]|nr:hypothetical protein [Anaerolineae bacterium]